MVQLKAFFWSELVPVLQITVSCRIAVVMMQYSIMANTYWLLVEGIYLHNLLVITVFTERNYFKIYLCIGWGEFTKTKSNDSYFKKAMDIQQRFLFLAQASGSETFLSFPTLNKWRLSSPSSGAHPTLWETLWEPRKRGFFWPFHYNMNSFIQFWTEKSSWINSYTSTKHWQLCTVKQIFTTYLEMCVFLI